MSFHDLKSLVSAEDFADAHEPLNDGVKEVPNAQTVAASVTTGEVGTDTTNAGPAKTQPKVEESEEGNSFTEVKESAEKKTPEVTSSAKPEEDTSTDTEAKPTPEAEGTSEDDKEPLEHDNAKTAESELKKTDEATTALENYSGRAKRFDVIGYPRREREQLEKMIGFISRRSGVTLSDSISVESIAEAATIGRARVAHLEKQVKLHARKASTENFDAVVEAEVTAEPTEHGSAPLCPEVAAELTATEIDPLDVPLTEITQVEETIDALTQSGVAIEQYLKIIRANPKMSKQAAAVLHAGLEHIDRTCGLKVRSTGMEGYLTTPRAAMEEADVSEKSLTSRAGEIGAKIMQWVKRMIDLAISMWDKYRVGINGAIKDNEELNGKLATVKDPGNGDKVTFKNPSTYLFMDGDFIGTQSPTAEFMAGEKISTFYNMVTKRGIGYINKALKTGNDLASIENNIAEAIDYVKAGSIWTDGSVSLPGNMAIQIKGDRLEVASLDGTNDVPESIDVDVHLGQLKQSFKQLLHFLNVLNDDHVIAKLKSSSDDMIKEFVAMRKRLGGDIDEAEFQKIQTMTIEWLNKTLDVKVYFQAMETFVKGARAKIYLGNAIVGSLSKTDE